MNKYAKTSIIAIILIVLSGCLEVDDPVNIEDVETEIIGDTYLEEVTTISPTALTPNPTPISEPTSTVPTRLELEIGETALNSKTEVTIISIEKNYYYEYMGYSDVISEDATYGKTFIIVDVNMKNVGMDKSYLGSYDLSITDSNGYRYDSSYYYGDNGLESIQELYQNQQIRGIVIFEIPKDATGLGILYDFGDIFGGTQIASWVID